MNRVFNSAGPEGKVNGTPSQIIDKYQAMARDAQLSGDRVAAENFQQHAEHYTRMLSEAQREQAERQAREDRQREQQNAGGGGGSNGSQQPQQQRGDGEQPSVDAVQPQASQPQPVQAEADQDRDDVLGGGADLVDTPESGAAKAAQEKPRKPRSRARRAAPKTEDGAAPSGTEAETPAE
ncbi:DUF4167 domain-containing protein [Oceanibium sediminis]|uniref:DUF4167 domain-containing protein n=1 Tax=Oceanibium sediminis TaxID=2026339 RepID=UPI001E5F66E8